MKMAGETEPLHKPRSEKQTYLKLCKLSNIIPQECVLQALTLAVEKGELDLSGKTETSTGWEVIAKTVVSSTSIKCLVLRDCLLPTRGMASLVAALCQGSEVTSIDLRGNNIGESGATQLGKLLRHSTTLQSLSLEWNRLGAHIDSFGLFCAGVALAPALSALDVRNNALDAECAAHLASALRQSAVLRCLDLRWNCVGFKGGQLLLAAVQENATIAKIRMQGNAVPDELVVAVETLAGRNGAHAEALRVRAERLRSEARATAERMRDRAAADDRIRQAQAESEKEASALRSALAERDAALATLRAAADAADVGRRDSEQRLAERTAGGEADRREAEARVHAVAKRLADREAELLEQLTQREAELSAERRLRLAAESRADQLANQVAALDGELAVNAEKARAGRQQLEESTLAAQASASAALASARREADAQLESQRSETQQALARESQRWQAAQRDIEALAAKVAETSAALAREQARGEESTAAALKCAWESEESRVSALERRLAAARDESAGLEARLAAAAVAATGLQQHNAALLAELTAPQRALAKANEELIAERQTTQRLRQEVEAEAARTAARLRECEDMRTQLARQQLEASQLAQTHVATLAALAQEAELERQRWRREEATRAQALCAAVNQYLGQAGKV